MDTHWQDWFSLFGQWLKLLSAGKVTVQEDDIRVYYQLGYDPDEAARQVVQVVS